MGRGRQALVKDAGVERNGFAAQGGLESKPGGVGARVTWEVGVSCVQCSPESASWEGWKQGTQALTPGLLCRGGWKS